MKKSVSIMDNGGTLSFILVFSKMLMSKSYRSKTEIMIEILDMATAGARKSEIMYKCFLSYAQNVKYLDFLLEKGLIEYKRENKTYRTTDRGRYFLLALKEAGAILARAK